MSFLRRTGQAYALGGNEAMVSGLRTDRAFRTKAHLIGDETVAKMGHPDLWLS
jgi:hypothetical protein